MTVEPSARLAKVPLIGVAAVLLMAVKTLPAVSFLFPTVLRSNCAPALDRHSISDYLVGFGFFRVQFPSIGAIALEGEGVLDRESGRVARAFARLKRSLLRRCRFRWLSPRR